MAFFSMTSLHVDLNETAKCVHVDVSIHVANFLIAHLRTRTKYKVATTFGLVMKNGVGE